MKLIISIFCALFIFSMSVHADEGTDKEYIETVYWETIKDSEDLSDFETFIKKFPDGIFVEFAWKKLKVLKGGTSTTPKTPGTPQSIAGGAIIVTATANPPVLSRGQQTVVNVYVQDSRGRPLPHAMVTLSSGGGRFNRTGTPTVSGPSDSSGSFVGYWSCDPCAAGYVSGVRVTKQGYTDANAEWRVQIR